MGTNESDFFPYLETNLPVVMANKRGLNQSRSISQRQVGNTRWEMETIICTSDKGEILEKYL